NADERPSRTSQPREDQAEQTQRHGRSSCPTATPHLSRQVTAIGRLLAPHRRIAAAHRPGRLSSSRRDFHPPALADPYVTVSRHTALAVLLTRQREWS